jgi:GH43 family beta-xylosidase
MKKHISKLFVITALVAGTLSMSSAAANNETALPAALVEQRADPSLYKADNGHYYFVATAPEYDRIELRAAKTMKGIGSATPQIVFKKHEKGPMGAHIWAPEILQIDGVWYIYFAAGDAEDVWRIRMYVLANKSADPTKGKWEELGQVKTARESFSLDANSFVANGQRYYIWAQRDAEETVNSALYLAKMTSPTTIGDVEAKITTPEFDWEVQGYKVNEGPAIIVRHGKVFVSYSASATDHRYAMGLLWANEDANLLNPKSWHKLPKPVFWTNEKLHRYGPGHNSFVVAEDGKTDVLVYHARDYLGLQGSPLTDPNRHTYLRTFKWTKEGFPDFGQDQPDDIKVDKNK